MSICPAAVLLATKFYSNVNFRARCCLGFCVKSPYPSRTTITCKANSFLTSYRLGTSLNVLVVGLELGECVYLVSRILEERVRVCRVNYGLKRFDFDRWKKLETKETTC